ncbi:hypothetical protein P4O66_008290 [Electrophorus voltai]|uniref:Uncharacterized protein n=1 Tax=Electrophorus voltai TaxID=2609070 RepID=A0AAD9DY71_9TELE|nr:hypothetical protein P4O66_008290 [Electrophorus voltai]
MAAVKCVESVFWNMADWADIVVREQTSRCSVATNMGVVGKTWTCMTMVVVARSAKEPQRSESVPDLCQINQKGIC